MADEEKKELEDLEPQQDAKGGKTTNPDAIYMKNAASLDAGQSADRASLDANKSLD